LLLLLILSLFPHYFPTTADHSRVKLRFLAKDPFSDYINANFLSDISPSCTYIACQAPLPTTVGDFWRMIMEKSSPIIVMLTREVELNKIKCDRYWPRSAEEPFETEQYRLELDQVSEFPDLTVRRFLVRTLTGAPSTSDTLTTSIPSGGGGGGGELTEPSRNSNIFRLPQYVTQFHFTGFPDNGIPESIDTFINLVERVEEYCSQVRSGPITVHCRCVFVRMMIQIDE
jgi:protein tyrosine phosphatase